MTAVHWTLVAGSGVLWFAGLRLFLRSGLPRHRKLNWSVFLLVVGIGVGFLLPMAQVWNKLRLVLAMVPLLALADVWLLRSGHGWSFWVRGCGFEVCTVFGTAAVARFLFDIAGIAPLVERAG